MDTYFAPAERANPDQLNVEIEVVVHSPVVQELLHSINGLVAVLDEHRQVVALNDSLLRTMGITDPEAMLGLRPGNVLGCIHCTEEPNGCGTTKYCSTCGAAIAIVSTLGSDRPVERMCALTARRDDSVQDYSLLVRSQPLKIDGRKFLLLLLQDVTLEQLRAALERTFFHDMGNMLTGLMGATEFMLKDRQWGLVEIVHKSALRLHKEIEIQQCLFKNDVRDYRLIKHEITPQQLLRDLENVFAKHCVAKNRRIVLPKPLPQTTIHTDVSLALRVMCNMVTNAFEATEENGAISLWFDDAEQALLFNVWNRKAIPEEVKYRIFQRSFSTKEGSGRGIGTYSMQLLGEKLLGGKVTFTSSEADGTTFQFALPR